MSLIENYDIKVGQIYHSADGSDHSVEVTDITSFVDCDDVVVQDTIGGLTLLETRRIDAFKLAKVRYGLCGECTSGDRNGTKPQEN